MSNTNEYLIEEEIKEIKANIADVYEEINSYIPKIIGSHIYDRKFGRGIIKSIDDGSMHVDFNGVRKTYAYPLPLTTTMKFDDGSQKYWKKIFKLNEKIDSLKKDVSKKTIELNKIKSSRNELDNSKQIHKVQWDAMNVIIKANYNNGGRNRTQCGYCGVCSDDIIDYNINTKKRRWCSNEDSFCFKYLNGEISRDELDDVMQDDGYVCYESQMLRNFSVLAGIKRFKIEGEKAVSIKNAGRGKLCVMTTVEPYKHTKDAIVFGMFIIGEVYVGDGDYKEGELSADSNYTLKFSPKEAEHFNLWDHYRNRNSPDNKSWGSGLIRYATDDMAVSFLKKAIELKRGTKDEKRAIEMYKFFCEENGIRPEL